MRARTMHCTSGRVSSNRGRLAPHPPEGFELSTGTPRGPAVVGVSVPGVAGGVKEGERSDGGGGGWEEDVPDWAVESDSSSMGCCDALCLSAPSCFGASVACARGE